jgi:hypothetical protein
MNVFELHKTEDIFDFFKTYRKSTRYQFRGQSNSKWPLIPKAGRPPFNKRNDKELFKQWKRRANAYLENKSLNDTELLTIAQHTGLPTRLLDWTYNPLVAVFFACTENQNIDGAIFAYKAKSYLSITNIEDPFELSKGSVKMLQPNSPHSRLINQFGYFTIHTEPTLELEQDTLNVDFDKIIIPSILKKELVFIINQLGVNNMTIFPDLDGLSKHLCWFYENYEYWTEMPDTAPSPPCG